MEYRVRKRNVSNPRRWPRSAEEVLPDATIRRFLLRAGFRSSSDRAAAEVRRHVCDFFRRIVGCMVTMMQHDNRRSFRLIDVQRACEHFGIRMYGYDDMCLLAAGRVCGPEAYHVTELVECSTMFSRPQQEDDEPDTEPSARFKKTNFAVNYSTWKEDFDGEMSEPSEWACSDDSDTASDGDEEDMGMETVASRPWHSGPTDDEQFISSLQDAQDVVDAKLLCKEPEAEELECEAPPGQGYLSDYDDIHEPAYISRQQADEQHEDAQWNTIGELHVVESDEDGGLAQLQDPSGDSNLYVIARQDFFEVFRTLLNHSLKLGELQISAVALSALHNATEQCLHRSLTEGSLHFQLKAILREQEHVSLTLQLDSELQMQREKVNELCKTIADNKAAFKAKELAMQQQIIKLKQQLQGVEDVRMQTPPSWKKSTGKRKATSKSTQVVRTGKGSSKSSSGSTSIVGALRSRGQNFAGTKKAKLTPL
ncbi:hypothetical protein BBJ28_00004212 [Nothophytophthora sp. Chile5]|nr:hypothetical protein BBJ28_00004212 [Nothophytophthora sp. Chile5]